MCLGWIPSLIQTQRTLFSSRHVAALLLHSLGFFPESGAWCSGILAMTVYVSVQTMYRIKDPKRSLDFYTRVIGMRYVPPCMQPNLSVTRTAMALRMVVIALLCLFINW